MRLNRLLTRQSEPLIQNHGSVGPRSTFWHFLQGLSLEQDLRLMFVHLLVIMLLIAVVMFHLDAYGYLFL